MSRLAILLAAVLCAACVTNVELRPLAQPARAAGAAGRSSEAAGAVCTPGLLARREQASFTAFELGEPLCSALVGSVAGAYRSAQRVETPYKGQFGRVIRFYLNSSALDVRQLPDGSVRAAYSVGVAVESCGRDLAPRERKLVTGNAVVTRGGVPTADVVKEAAEAAVQQVADNAERLLVAGLDGPRVREPVPAAPER